MNPNHAPLSSWMSRLVARRAGGPLPSSLLQARTEVRPPAQWPSATSWRGGWQRWWNQFLGRLPEPARPINRLAVVKDEFLASVSDLQHNQAQLLADRIARARSLRELWHLRSTVYSLVATVLNQREAERRVSQLNRHFPMRAARGVPEHLEP